MINKEAIILDVLKRIKQGFRDPYIKEPWDKGWSEIAEKIKQEFSFEALRPQYYNGDEICRHDGEYRSSELHDAYDRALRKNAVSYLKDSKRVIEIGCGTGINLPLIADACPDAEIIAADWSEASQEIVSHIAKHLNRPIQGVKYNMFSPHPIVDAQTSVLTVHAMEQLGTKWQLLLDEMLKARLCVHLEPIYEIYENNLMDYIAQEYHKARGYLTGFLPAIRKLEREGKARIIACERRKFGNRYHDSYSLLVWRPLAG